MMRNNLEWNVFIENPNSRKIEKYNIFGHFHFYNAILKLKKEVKKFLKENPDPRHVLKYKEGEFSERLSREAHYYFWAKCEWEIILTSWPPYVSGEEVDRLQKEKSRYNTTVNLPISKKVDVYTQLEINWGVFVDYVWGHLFTK